MISLLELPGFSINREKSTVIPCQKINFLGFVIDSLRMTLSLSEEKLRRIQEKCLEALRQEKVTVRHLSRMIGRMTAAVQAVLPAPLHYRALQFLKNSAFCHSQLFENQVVLNQEARKDLLWWIEEVRHWNGRCLKATPPELPIETGASLLGWGASLDLCTLHIFPVKWEVIGLRADSYWVYVPGK